MGEIEVTSGDGMLLDAMMGNANGSIERQEAEGARQMVAATHTLPTGGSENIDFILWGPILEDDPLFREATLPEGWTRKLTDHDMWTEIFDDQGVKRAAVFYKAAFYDRKASIREFTAEDRRREAEWLIDHPEEKA